MLFATFFVMRKFRPYMVSYPRLAALLVPIVVCLLPIHVVHDRQGFNWGYANLVMAAPAILVLYLATHTPDAYWIGANATQ